MDMGAVKSALRDCYGIFVYTDSKMPPVRVGLFGRIS
jgi:hypothetical protein